MTKSKYIKKTIDKEKALDKKHYLIIVSFFIIFLLYNYYWGSETIGHDFRHTLFIIILPLFIGLVSIAVYRYRYLKNQFFSIIGLREKFIWVMLYLAIGLFASFATFGLLANIGWNYFNQKASEQNPSEVFVCKVTKIQKAAGRYGQPYFIDFELNNRNERLYVGRDFVKETDKENPTNCLLHLNVQEGIWHYYVLTNYVLIKKVP